jgi:hypothetical protein
MNAMIRYLVPLAVILNAALAPAQLQLSARGGGATAYTPAQTQFPSPWSGPLRWLIDRQAQQDLELNDDQTQAVSRLQTDIRQQTQDLYQQMREWPPDERQKRLQETNQRLVEEVDQRIQEILLPEQVSRLRQVELQMRLRSYVNLGQQLSSEDLADELGLTKRQREQIRERGQRLRQEIQAKMREFQARMQAEAEQEILKTLTPGQRKKLEQLKGDPFDWSPQGSGQTKPPAAKR